MSAESQVEDRDLIMGPESGLERKLIAEYLHSKGFRMADLRHMPKEQRKVLMKEACLFAAIRLANIEAKTKFRRKINLPR